MSSNKKQTCIGVKIIDATPMSRGEYNILRGWDIPQDEDPNDHGFLVEYKDGGQANVEGYKGYVSWSPKAVFENAYRPTTGLTFGHAVEAVKGGSKVARKGWNGKGMFIFLVQGSTFTVNRPPLLGIYPEGTRVNYHAHIDMKTADDTVVPWLASQTDVLADDWMIVD